MVYVGAITSTTSCSNTEVHMWGLLQGQSGTHYSQPIRQSVSQSVSQSVGRTSIGDCLVHTGA
jgi:hypothetical protein